MLLSNTFCDSPYVMVGCSSLWKSTNWKEIDYPPAIFPTHRIGKAQDSCSNRSYWKRVRRASHSSHRYLDVVKTCRADAVRPFGPALKDFPWSIPFWSYEQLSSSLFSKALPLPSRWAFLFRDAASWHLREEALKKGLSSVAASRIFSLPTSLESCRPVIVSPLYQSRSFLFGLVLQHFWQCNTLENIF